MEPITLPRLRLNKLQTLAESSLEICKDITGIEPAREKVETTLEIFKKAMLKVEASASNKQKLDLKRDHSISGFFTDVKAEMLYPHEDESVKTALIALKKILNKYGLKINRLPFDEESAAIDNMITDLKAFDFTPLEVTNLKRWVDIIENDNNAFKTAANDYIEDAARAAEVDSATKLAQPLADALEGMYALVMANLMISQTDPLKKAYAQLQELVDSVK